MTNCNDIHDDIKIKLNDENVSYVLITCKSPQKDGTMDVKMSFEGDPLVVEYLLFSAHDKVSLSN